MIPISSSVGKQNLLKVPSRCIEEVRLLKTATGLYAQIFPVPSNERSGRNFFPSESPSNAFCKFK